MKTRDQKRRVYLDFYRTRDSTYNSYWVGRFVRSFFKYGHRQTIEKQAHAAFRLLWLEAKKPANVIIYELIEEVKPVFALKARRLSRRKTRLHPYMPTRARQYLTALRWIKKEVDYS
jgi:small subunit ribosomal protein S7